MARSTISLLCGANNGLDRTRRIWTPLSSAVRKAFSKSYGGDMHAKSLRECNHRGLGAYRQYAYQSNSYQAMAVVAQRRIGVGGTAPISSTDQGGGKRRAVISQHGFRLGGPPQEFPYQSLCSAFNQAQNEQQNNRTDEGVDNRGNKTAPD